MCDEFHTWSDKFLRKSSIMSADIFEVILSNPKKRKRENNVGGAYNMFISILSISLSMFNIVM